MPRDTPTTPVQAFAQGAERKAHPPIEPLEPMAVGLVVRAFRELNDNMPANVLAAKVGLNASAISRLEQGKRELSFSEAGLIAKELGFGGIEEFYRAVLAKQQDSSFTAYKKAKADLAAVNAEIATITKTVMDKAGASLKP